MKYLYNAGDRKELKNKVPDSAIHEYFVMADALEKIFRELQYLHSKDLYWTNETFRYGLDNGIKKAMEGVRVAAIDAKHSIEYLKKM